MGRETKSQSERIQRLIKIKWIHEEPQTWIIKTKAVLLTKIRRLKTTSQEREKY